MKEHVLNLNTAKRPAFTLTLMDDEQTTLHINTPSMDMFKELQAVATELSMLDDDDPETESMAYDFTARLLSCNRERITITPEELRGKYNMDLDSLLLVYEGYMGFLNDIAKN